MKVGWWNNSILWCTVKKTSNYLGISVACKKWHDVKFVWKRLVKTNGPKLRDMESSRLSFVFLPEFLDPSRWRRYVLSKRCESVRLLLSVTGRKTWSLSLEYRVRVLSLRLVYRGAEVFYESCVRLDSVLQCGMWDSRNLRYNLLFVLVSKYLKFLTLVINGRVFFLWVLMFLFVFPRNKCAWTWGPSWLKRFTWFLSVALRPHVASASSFLRFTNHNGTPVGRSPLDECSARRRDLYLTAHNTHNRQTSMPPVGFRPIISAGERPHSYALYRAATVISVPLSILIILNSFPICFSVIQVQSNPDGAPASLIAHESLSTDIPFIQAQIAARTNSGAISGFVWIVCQVHRKQEASYDEWGESACFKRM